MYQYRVKVMVLDVLLRGSRCKERVVCSDYNAENLTKKKVTFGHATIQQLHNDRRSKLIVLRGKLFSISVRALHLVETSFNFRFFQQPA